MNRFLIITFLAGFVLSGCSKADQENKPSAPQHTDTVQTDSSASTASLTATKDNIEQMAADKIDESIKFLNEQSRRESSAESNEDYFKYSLNAKNIIKADLNHDGKPDYLVEATFCEETSCHATTLTYELFVFTTSQQGQIQYMTSIGFGLDAKVTDVSKDGVISIQNHAYADDDPSCCPSIINNHAYALVGSTLKQLAS